MKRWTIKDARRVRQWASTSEGERRSIEGLAAELARTPEAIKQFLRRELPPGSRPWAEKRRWQPGEIEVILANRHRHGDGHGRSKEAIKKFLQRTRPKPAPNDAEHVEEGLSISEVAGDLGRSTRTIYRWLEQGFLRRWRGRVAESSYMEFLKNCSDKIPYSTLTREQKEWLVLNGYPDITIKVKPPSTKGLLE